MKLYWPDERSARAIVGAAFGRDRRTSMSAQPNLGMQPTTFENPMGIDGFEFVEFAAPDADSRKALRELFKRMGFSPVLRHKSRAITVFRQGGVNFLLNAEPVSYTHLRAHETPEHLVCRL